MIPTSSNTQHHHQKQQQRFVSGQSVGAGVIPQQQQSAAAAAAAGGVVDTVTTLRTALGYSLLVLLVPLAAFFVSRSLLFAGLLRWDTSDSTLYAVGVTVVTVHVVLVVYLMRVMSDDAAAAATGSLVGAKLADKHD